MNTPGVSLFQGADIKVNSTLHLEEEEEALADQRRHNEELGNLLQNAFDDLEEDETTTDSITNFQSDVVELFNKDGQQHEEQTNEKLQYLNMLLDSRTRELESIKQMANESYKKNDELQKRLTISEAELDRALASKKNTHELLVESKEKCSNLENTIATLRNEKKELEAKYNALLGKLETSQTLLADIQRKYDMVERDMNKHNEHTTELRQKQVEERHRAEVEMLRQQMEQLANKLEKKKCELDSMSVRYDSLQGSHNMMLVDKTTVIDDLSKNLRESQKKYEELLGKQDYFQENVRLQKLVASMQEQIEGMEKTISSLNERLEFTTAELDVMDSVLHQHNLEGTPRRLSQTQGRLIGSTPLSMVDRVGNLKYELHRALTNVKSKREEVRKLQYCLDEKNAEVRRLKEDENKALVQIATLKEDKLRLENKLKIVEEEFEDLRSKTLNESMNCRKFQSLSKEFKKVQEEKSVLEQQRIDLEHERNNQELERRKLDAQLRNVEVDLEELKQEHESMKLNYDQILKENKSLRSRTTADNVRLELEKHKFLLKDAQAECDRLKNLYVEISNAKEALGYEMEKIHSTDHVKELQAEREKVSNLQRSLQLVEVKSSEIAKILDAEKLCHEREMRALREKTEKEKTNSLKATKDSSNNCIKCLNYLAEITKFEIQNLKLANFNSANKKEIDELTEELSKSKTLIAELTEKLKLSEQQEQLIKELKRKAHQFEEYIKNQSSSSVCSTDSPKQKNRSDKGVSTSPELNKKEIKRIESRIRDEMAKIFANELKRFQVKLHQIEEKNVCLQREYQHTSTELQQRQVEVDLLKQAILAEREQMNEILKQKDDERLEVVEKQNAMLRRCRDELQMKNSKISELAKEFEERQIQIEAERKSMKAVMSQWEKQRKSVDVIESEWKEKLHEQKKAHEIALTSWQKKYNSAKRTIDNYKRYAEDQEAHMRKEYERIKLEYDASLAKIEVCMQDALEKKTRETKDAIAAIKQREKGCDKENEARNK